MNDAIMILVLAVAIAFAGGLKVGGGYQPKAGGKKPRAPRTGSGVFETAGRRPPIRVFIHQGKRRR